MAITFLCPNGHRLSCPEHHAGRAGQCPDCGSRFRIPEPELIPADTASSPPADSTHVESDADQIVFLCPNGHRLHGPHSLAGRAGQCPHCGVRFRIPAFGDDEPDAEAAPANPATDEHNAAIAETAELPLEEIEEIEEIEEVGDDQPAESGEPTAVVGANAPVFDFAALDRTQRVPDLATPFGLHLIDEDGVETPPSAAHPLAELLEQWWDSEGRAGTIEVRLESGETLSPDSYAANWSRRSHAFFAVRAADGRHSLVAVPWQRVAKITIQGLEQLPPEFS